MLRFYNSSFAVFTDDILRTSHLGQSGGADEVLVYIRNDDPANYYTNIRAEFVDTVADDYGPFGSTGWSVKFLPGSRQPTAEEWDSVIAGEAVTLDDIGTEEAADTATYHPLWVRVFCPGESPAQRRTGQTLRLWYNEQKVGS